MAAAAPAGGGGGAPADDGLLDDIDEPPLTVNEKWASLPDYDQQGIIEAVQDESELLLKSVVDEFPTIYVWSVNTGTGQVGTKPGTFSIVVVD